MTLLGLVLVLVVIGVVLWGVQQLPLDPAIKNTIRVVVIVVVVVWLASSLVGMAPRSWNPRLW